MGLGVLYGSPQTPFSVQSYASGDRLADWIEQEVPCFSGNVPVEYTKALLQLFYRHAVPEWIVQDAFRKLAAKGIRFDFPNDGPVVPQRPPAYDLNNPPPRMGPASAGDEKYGIEEYERKYVLALTTDNPGGAEAALVAVLELIWGLAKGGAKMRQAARHEKVAEWEEFNR